MSPKTIYFGRFISTPTPTDLLIRHGAVLVVGTDGVGAIEKTDWDVKNPEEAKAKFGEGVQVVTAEENGFFFPGYIGLFLSFTPLISSFCCYGLPSGVDQAFCTRPGGQSTQLT